MVCNSLRLIAGAFLTVCAAGAAAPVIAQQGCESALAAETSAGAMVRLSVSSACHAGQDVIVHHNGMMITEQLDDAGMLMIAVPALTETALFMAEFVSDGMVAVASTEVPSLSFYDRVALLWQGDMGLELHAREFDGDYMSDDHVWREAPRSMDRAALGEGGFIVALGNGDSLDAHKAEVYTFPSATVSRQGNVLMSVEAVVGENNCDQDVSAQAIQVKSNGDLIVREVDIAMPDCESSGDLLILDTLVDDIKSGSN